jgi:hypothetical protein
MKLFCITAILIFPLCCFSQYDTALISKAFNYIKTTEVKEQLIHYVNDDIKKTLLESPTIKKDEKRYRKQETSKSEFWLHPTLALDSVYFVPILATRIIHRNRNLPDDSLDFRTFDTIACKREKHIDSNYLFIEPFILSSNVVEFRYFIGVKGGNIWFGETNILRLKIDADSPKILFQGTTFHN